MVWELFRQRRHRATVQEKLWTWEFLRLCLSHALLNTFMQMLVAAFPLYLGAEAFSASQVGLVVGGYTVCTIVMRVLSGSLVDQAGRQVVGLAGIALFTLPLLGYLFFSSLTIIVGCRLLQGFGASAMSLCVGAMAADILPKSRLAEGLGYFGLCVALSTALGPALGVALAETGQMYLLFLVCLGGMAVGFGLVLSLNYEKTGRHETKPAEEETSPSPAAESGAVGGVLQRWLFRIFEPAAIPISCVSLLLSFCIAVSINYVAPFAQYLNIQNAGLYFTIQAISMFAVRFFSGRIANRIGYFGSLAVGIAVIIGGFFLLGITDSFFSLMLAGFVYGAGSGLAWPMFNVLCLHGVAPNHRGKALSTYFASYDLGMGLGGFCWGLVIDLAGYRSIFFISAALSLLSLVLATALRRWNRGIYEEV